MKFKIIKHPDYTNVYKTGVSLTPDSDVLKYFLSGLKIAEIPDLLDSLMNSTAFNNELISLLVYSEMDWEDIERYKIKENEIYIFHQYFGGQSFEQEFIVNLVLAYCKELLYDCLQDNEYPDEWYEQVNSKLEKLKEKRINP